MPPSNHPERLCRRKQYYIFVVGRSCLWATEMSFFADKSPRDVGSTGVAFLQPPILKRSTSLPVSELTRLFVEGDKRRNEVSVSFRCCDYTAVRVTIVRNAVSGAPLLDFHLEGKNKIKPDF